MRRWCKPSNFWSSSLWVHAMVRCVSNQYLRRIICFAPRKCFLLLIISVGFMFVLFLWNQTGFDHHEPVLDPGGHSSDHLLSSSSNVSFPYLSLEKFQYFTEPDKSACGVGIEDERAKIGMRSRWNELLQARPDNEEPEPPEVVKSSGLIFMETKHDEIQQRKTIRRTWANGAWMRGARLRLVFVYSTGSTKDLKKGTFFRHSFPTI